MTVAALPPPVAEKRSHLFLAIAYATLLCWIYTTEIVPIYGYMGFDGIFSLANYAQAIIIVSIFALSLPVRSDTRSLTLVSILYLFLIPSAVYVSLSEQRPESVALLVGATLSIIIISRLQFALPRLGQFDSAVLRNGMLAITLFLVGAQAYFGGLENFNLDIERVYEFRRESASDLPEFFAYVYSNVSNVFIPFLLITAYIRKNYLQIMLLFTIVIILFGMSHHKSVIFGPPLAFGLYIFFSRNWPIIRFPNAFLFVPLISVFEIGIYRLAQSIDPAYFTSLLIRRTLFIPPLLDAKYFEFFSVNPLYYWSSSRIFSPFIESNYNISAPFIIGYEYFQDLDTSANTGIIGSGFANGSYWGVLLYSVLVGILISFLNSAGSRISHAFVAAFSFLTIFNLFTSTDLLTAFLTHGLLTLILVLTFCSSDLTTDRRQER
jgi:hypothetical protein